MKVQQKVLKKEYSSLKQVAEVSFNISKLILESWLLFAKCDYLRIIYYCVTKAVFQNSHEVV
jgi:hypothetical protein